MPKLKSLTLPGLQGEYTVPQDGTQMNVDDTAQEPVTIADELSSLKETKVDQTTTVNGHPLSGNVTVTDTDIEHGTETVGAALTRIEGAKVTALSSTSTDAQYPSAKCVYDELYGGRIWTGTQAEYDAIAVKGENTIYMIVEGTT